MNKINKENIITILILVSLVGTMGFYSGRLYEGTKIHNNREKFMQSDINSNKGKFHNKNERRTNKENNRTHNRE